ncbi:MAG TPA: oligosaccharide flippase family protein, partial [Terriglobia bacterium]|nr:oligosaccharide flippase family protein [Terriglobia bacterium]
MAEILSRVMTGLATVFVARTIGVRDYGLVGFVAAVLAYLVEFIRFGTDPIIVRELARTGTEHEAEQSKFRTVAVAARTVFVLPAIAILVILSCGTSTTPLRYLYVAGIVQLLGTLFPIDLFLQSEEKFKFLAAFKIFSNAVNLTLILILVHSPSTSWVVPLASGFGLLVSEAIFSGSMSGYFAIPSVDELLRFGERLLRQSLPLLGSMILLLMAGQFTVILVRALSQPDELGWYTAGYKMYDVCNAFLVPASIVIFPALSSSWDTSDSRERTRIILPGIAVALCMSLLIVGFTLLSAKSLVPIVFGREFERSSVFLSILTVALFFRSISMFFSNALVAAGKQSVHLVIT